jgi:hypothetical protein
MRVSYTDTHYELKKVQILMGRRNDFIRERMFSAALKEMTHIKRRPTYKIS